VIQPEVLCVVYYLRNWLTFNNLSLKNKQYPNDSIVQAPAPVAVEPNDNAKTLRFTVTSPVLGQTLGKRKTATPSAVTAHLRGPPN
jgi:hypothetical protein